jgi:hypothetical protein
VESIVDELAGLAFGGITSDAALELIDALNKIKVTQGGEPLTGQCRD